MLIKLYEWAQTKVPPSVTETVPSVHEGVEKYLAAGERKVLADVHLKELLLMLQACGVLQQGPHAGLPLNACALQCTDPCMALWHLQAGTCKLTHAEAVEWALPTWEELNRCVRLTWLDIRQEQEFPLFSGLAADLIIAEGSSWCNKGCGFLEEGPKRIYARLKCITVPPDL